MRIVGGKWRGRKLTALGAGDAAARLRPTSDRARESLFNMLSHRLGGFDGLRVLDLFAGTGALGFEALSRGAAHVSFVEQGRIGAKLIRENAALLSAMAQMTLLKRDARTLPRAAQPVDLVFADPPYGRGLGTAALEAALKAGWVGAECLLVLEEGQDTALPPGFLLVETRRTGAAHLHFARPAPC